MVARGKNFTIQSDLPMRRLPAFKCLTFYPFFLLLSCSAERARLAVWLVMTKTMPFPYKQCTSRVQSAEERHKQIGKPRVRAIECSVMLNEREQVRAGERLTSR